MKVYLNGKILSKKLARLNLLDSGFLFGEGLFETMRAYDGKIFLLKEHLERLFNSAKILGLKIPSSKTELAKACEQILKANQLKSARLRLTISSRQSLSKPHLKNAPSPIILITALPLPEKRASQTKIKLVKAQLSLSRNYLLAQHKTISYFPYLYSYHQAQKKGADDALLFTDDKILLEATRANIFLVKNGILLTPSLNLPLLPGITRAKVIALASKVGIKVIQGELSEKDLLNCQGAFLTNSIIEIQPVASYEDKIFLSEEAFLVIEKLRKAYQEKAKS